MWVAALQITTSTFYGISMYEPPEIQTYMRILLLGGALEKQILSDMRYTYIHKHISVHIIYIYIELPSMRPVGIVEVIFTRTNPQQSVWKLHVAVLWPTMWVNIGSGNSLLPDGRKSLSEPMLIIINEASWHLADVIFTGTILDVTHYNVFENDTFELRRCLYCSEITTCVIYN